MQRIFSISQGDKKECPAHFFLPALFSPGKENELVLSSLFRMLSGSEPGECGMTSSWGHTELFHWGLPDGSGRGPRGCQPMRWRGMEQSSWSKSSVLVQ